VRGFLIGLFLLFVLVTSVLSLRPGGLRNQLRNVGRRLKLALGLAGIYLVATTALRLAFRDGPIAEGGTLGIAAVLGIAFLLLGQDRQLDGR
jgi:hypothetical protein